MWVPEGVSKNILKYQVLFPFYFFFVWSFSYPIPQNRFSSTGLTTCDQEHRAQSVPPTLESHNKLTSGFPLTPCRTATSEHSPRFILIVYIIVTIQKSTSFNCITWPWQWGAVVLLGVLRNSGKGKICIVFHTSWLIGHDATIKRPAGGSPVPGTCHPCQLIYTNKTDQTSTVLRAKWIKVDYNRTDSWWSHRYFNTIQGEL